MVGCTGSMPPEPGILSHSTTGHKAVSVPLTYFTLAGLLFQIKISIIVMKKSRLCKAQEAPRIFISPPTSANMQISFPRASIHFP